MSRMSRAESHVVSAPHIVYVRFEPGLAQSFGLLPSDGQCGSNPWRPDGAITSGLPTRALYFAFRNHVSGERGPLSWSKQCHALVLSPFKKRSGRSRWRQEFGTSNSVIREGQYGGASP